MDEEMKELKSVLRSLVVSSPAQVDVRSLQRDYRTMMGSAIPVHKWGYRDVLTFLQERCKDCFLIHGSSGNPVLTLIVPDSLKHIDKFVQNQKASSVTKMKGKRRSVPDTIIKPSERPLHKQSPNLITETFNARRPNSNQVVRPIANNQPLHTKSYHEEAKPTANNVPMSTHSYKQEARPIVKTSPVRTNGNMATNYSYSRENTATDNMKSTYKPESTHEKPHRHEVQKSEKDSNDNVHSFLKKRLPLFDSTMGLDTKHTSESEKVAAKQLSDSGRLTASSSESRRTRLEQLAEELLELLQAHPRGIVITDLMHHYRERFDRELELRYYGHHTLTSLLCAMDDRVAFADSAEGVRVLDPSAPPPPRQKPRPVVPVRVPTARSDPDDALPGIDIDPEAYPADCMHLLDSIPGPDLSGVRAGDMFKVAVGEVYSPSHFWLQRLGAEHAGAMHAIMDDMMVYYSSGEGRERTLPRAALRPGQYCAAFFVGDWHRALIVKVIDSDTVKVRYVDYGTVGVAKLHMLKPLLRQYGTLPAQAVRARLAGLRPCANARRWPHSAAAYFLQLVIDKYFYANVMAVDEEEDVVETLLIDTSTNDDVSLSTEMVRAGHADWRADSALASGESYLLPRWDVLDAGDTPSYGEIKRYLELDIDLDCVEEYRRHVPAALPTPSPPPSPAPAPDVAGMRVLRLRSPSPVACTLNVAAPPYVPRVTPYPARPASPRAPAVSPHAPARAPLVSPCAPLVSPRAPLANPRATLASPRAPLVSPGALFVSPHAPAVSPHAPAVSSHTPLASPRAPLVSPCAPLAPPRAPLAPPRAALAPPRATLVSPRAPFEAPHALFAPPSAAPRLQPQASVVYTQQSNVVHNVQQSNTVYNAVYLPASPQLPPAAPAQPPCCATCEWAVNLLNPNHKAVYTLLDRVTAHCYIMTLIYSGEIPAPPVNGTPAAAGPRGAPVTHSYGMSVPPGFSGQPVTADQYRAPAPRAHRSS